MFALFRVCREAVNYIIASDTLALHRFRVEPEPPALETLPPLVRLKFSGWRLTHRWGLEVPCGGLGGAPPPRQSFHV